MLTRTELFVRSSAIWYDSPMKTKTPKPALDRMIDPLGKCLTPESARRLLKLKADRRLQARVDYLADKSNEGTLTSQERSEYETYVNFGTFIAILKSKARVMLTGSDGA